MNDSNQNGSSKSLTLALTRFKVMSLLEDHLRAGQTLAQALRAASLRPWPDD